MLHNLQAPAAVYLQSQRKPFSLLSCVANCRKADVSIKNSEGKTAGEVAELNEQAELVELLKGDVKPEAV